MTAGVLAALGVVEQEGHVGELLGDSPDLIRGLGRLHEEDVGAGLAVAAGTLQRRVQALHRARVGAGDDEEVRALARGDRGGHLGRHLAGADELLALHVPALLGHDLVLEMDGGDAGRLVLVDRADHVERIAVSRVGVRDHRDPDRLCDPPRVVNHLREGEQSNVGPAQPPRGGPEPGHIDRGKARLLDEPRAERVIAAGRQHHVAGVISSARRGRTPDGSPRKGDTTNSPVSVHKKWA